MTTPSFEQKLRQALEAEGRGVGGLVQRLLSFCREQPTAFEWRDGRCRCRPVGGEAGEGADLALTRSAFRNILAQVAARCNERRPDSVSPYGGEGEIALEGEQPAVLQVSFTNTPDEQKLQARSAEQPRRPLSAAESAGVVQPSELAPPRP